MWIPATTDEIVLVDGNDNDPTTHVIIPDESPASPGETLARLAAEVAAFTEQSDAQTTSESNLSQFSRNEELLTDQDLTQLNASGSAEYVTDEWWRPVAIVHGKKSRLASILEQTAPVKRTRHEFQDERQNSNSPSSSSESRHEQPFEENTDFNQAINSLVETLAAPPPSAPKVIEYRFELMAPTSATVPYAEPSLTYLNQYQSYELKLAKSCQCAVALDRGIQLRSVVKIGFFERRLQFNEQELLTGELQT